MSNSIDINKQLIDISNNLTRELQNYKNNFLFYDTNTWNQNNYNTSKRNIDSYLTQANQLLTTLNDTIGNTQTQLTEEKDKFSYRQDYYKDINNNLISADTLKYDFNSLYNEQSLRNSEIFLGIVFLGLVVFGISRQ